MLYSCNHMTSVGVNGLTSCTKINEKIVYNFRQTNLLFAGRMQTAKVSKCLSCIWSVSTAVNNVSRVGEIWWGLRHSPRPFISHRHYRSNRWTRPPRVHVPACSGL